MRIVAWNLAGASAEKLERLRALKPDVAVVPECTLAAAQASGLPHAWCGTRGEKGLAVFGFGGVGVERLGSDEPEHQWVMPVRITGDLSFTLFAVWADNDRQRMREREGSADPSGPLRLALRTHHTLLRKGPVVVAGDFNHNAVWDEPLRSSNHSYAVADLASVGLESAYHRARACVQGEEPEATFYMEKDAAKPHHLDHCFVPADWAVTNVTVGSHVAHCAVGGPSDHAPLVVDVDPDRKPHELRLDVDATVRSGADDAWTALYVMVSETGTVAKVGACERIGNVTQRLTSVERKYQRRIFDPLATLRLVAKIELVGLSLFSAGDYDERWADIWAEVESLESALRLALGRRLGRMHEWTDYIHLDRAIHDDEWPSLIRTAWEQVGTLGASR